METDNRQQRRGHRDGAGTPRDVVFLFDVDNTLLDNDAVLGDYRAHLVRESGREAADHYVLVDDKLPILAAVKRIWGPRVTTVFPRQGHYALDPDVLSGSPPPDLAITRISDLLDCDLSALRGAAPGVTAPRRRDASTRPNDSQQDPWTGGRVMGVDP